jgi:hypothetical protein
MNPCASSPFPSSLQAAKGFLVNRVPVTQRSNLIKTERVFEFVPDEKGIALSDRPLVPPPAKTKDNGPKCSTRKPICFIKLSGDLRI